MFGKRGSASGVQERAKPAPAKVGPAPRAHETARSGAAAGAELAAASATVASPPIVPSAPTFSETRRSDTFYEVKSQIFGALIEAIDLTQLAKLDSMAAREEIRDIVSEIISIKNVVMSIAV